MNIRTQPTEELEKKYFLLDREITAAKDEGRECEQMIKELDVINNELCDRMLDAAECFDVYKEIEKLV